MESTEFVPAAFPGLNSSSPMISPFHQPAHSRRSPSPLTLNDTSNNSNQQTVPGSTQSTTRANAEESKTDADTDPPPIQYKFGKKEEV